MFRRSSIHAIVSQQFQLDVGCSKVSLSIPEEYYTVSNSLHVITFI